MSRRPAHGFPGGPPNPPYGDRSPRPAPTPQHTETVSLPPASAAPSDPRSERDELESTEPLETALPPKKRRTIRVVAAATGVALLATSLALMAQRRTEPVEDLVSSATTNTSGEQNPTPSGPAPGGNTPGIGTFASVSVDVCASMISQIGASNPFVTGREWVEGQPPSVQGTGGFSKPSWFVELPDTLDPATLVGDLRPSEPAMLNSISDGHALLYSPLTPESGSRLGVYRLSNGELVWSASLPQGVYPMSDTKRLYLIDRTSTTETRIAVIAPSRAQIEKCYAATGNPTPAVSPTNRTAVAHDGSLYVAFPVEGRGTTIEVLTSESSTQLLASAPSGLALHGIMGDADRKVLLASSGTGADLRVTGYTLAGANILAFERTPAEINAASIPAQWGADNDPTSSIAAKVPAQVETLEVQRATVSGAYAALVIGTNTDVVMLTAIDLDGRFTWRAPIIPAASSGMSITSGALHIAKDSPGTSGGPALEGSIIDLATGKTAGKVQGLRYATAIGNVLVAHSVRQDTQNRFVVAYRGAEEFGGVSSASATSIEPVASSEAALIVFAETEGKRYLVAFVLDPSTSEGPTS